MASGKPDKPLKKKKHSSLNPKAPPQFKDKKKRPPSEKKKKKKKKLNQKQKLNKIQETQNSRDGENGSNIHGTEAGLPTASQQLNFFVREFQSANGVQLSSLELESIKESSFLGLSKDLGEDVESLGKQIKVAFGSQWKQDLCEGQLVQGKIDPGSPAVLILSTSAIRAIELLRAFRSFTRECHSVKLFSKHMKVEEQVGLLKGRVNIGSGTPSRVKKLIDIEALGLSRLEVIVLDIHTDVKGYSLLTLPQVRDEFWDLYKHYFHPRLLQGKLRICLFGPLPDASTSRGKRRKVPTD